MGPGLGWSGRADPVPGRADVRPHAPLEENHSPSEASGSGECWQRYPDPGHTRRSRRRRAEGPRILRPRRGAESAQSPPLALGLRLRPQSLRQTRMPAPRPPGRSRESLRQGGSTQIALGRSPLTPLPAGNLLPVDLDLLVGHPLRCASLRGRADPAAGPGGDRRGSRRPGELCRVLASIPVGPSTTLLDKSDGQGNAWRPR